MYVQALLREMQSRRTSDTITTIYFGGGTPSQLDAEELRAIFHAIHENYTVSPDAEITFECNPDDVVVKQSKTLKDKTVERKAQDATCELTDLTSSELPILLSSLGVNRISMGVQSFDDEMLLRINRRHNAAQAFDAIRAFHNAGIHNISIDLIYALPGQTVTDFRHDVETVVSMVSQHYNDEHPLITHLSSYCLSIEEGTHLYNMRARGEIIETDEDTSLAMYQLLIERLSQAGFEHYEISNFALPSYHSRHNSAYWQGVPYTGLGPGAHSYDGQATRRWNRCDIHAYITDPINTYDTETLSADERYDELIMTRLRTRRGLPLSTVAPERIQYLLRQARPYISSGHLIIEEEPSARSLRLTRQGIFISDSIFTDLMCEM